MHVTLSTSKRWSALGPIYNDSQGMVPMIRALRTGGGMGNVEMMRIAKALFRFRKMDVDKGWMRLGPCWYLLVRKD